MSCENAAAKGCNIDAASPKKQSVRDIQPVMCLNGFVKSAVGRPESQAMHDGFVADVGFFSGEKCREFSTPMHVYPSRLGQGFPDELICPVGPSFPRVFGAQEPAARRTRAEADAQSSTLGYGFECTCGLRTDVPTQRVTRSVPMHEGAQCGNVRRELLASRCFLASRRSRSRLKDRIELLRCDLLLCASGQFPVIPFRDDVWQIVLDSGSGGC